MRRQDFVIWGFAGVVLSLLVPVLGSVVSQVYLSDWRWEHVPIHSLLEAAGGLMAVAIAAVLVAERSRQKDVDHLVWMSCALIGMGVLDLFHAAVHPGQHFVWLHSAATFVGGSLFALVWLPARYHRLHAVQQLPGVVLVAAASFGVVSCWTSQIPHMATGSGQFTPLARGLNMGGGCGFMIAAVFFVRRFHRTARKTDWLFSVHTMLFGAAGVLFELSILWDAGWWWWHLLRLVAYVAALCYAVGAFVDAERTLFASHQELAALNRKLDRTVVDKTSKLEISEERYELAVRGSTDGLWDWNVMTNEVCYADRFKELLGYCGEEFPDLFESFEAHLHEDDREHVNAAIRAHLEDRVPYDVEYRLRTKSGAYRWFRARGQALWDDSGKATRMAGSITDITVRRQAQESLLAAKEAAESANRAKSDFLANMSHEIRTPMNAVIGMTELVLDAGVSHPQQAYLRIVLESAESLLTIINEILDFSKIEAGRLELEANNFDLFEEVGDTLKSLAHRAHAKEVELAWHIGPKVPQYLMGDAMRLRQILVNLVGNAIKFTEQGEVVVDIRADSLHDSEVTLRFTVRDTGIGIPVAKQEQIFVPFEQVDTSTTRQYGGTGLGLAITSHLVQAMNGRIWVDSQPGQGSQFHIVVPFGPGDSPRESTAEQVDLSGLPILIVDDNATNRQILWELLEGRGMTVMVAERARDALQMLRECVSQGQPLPLLVSDVHMPDVDGFMLAEQVRSDPLLRDIKIVLLTSAGRPGDAERCQQLDISCRMMKPAKRSELLDTLATIFGRDSSLASVPSANQLPALPQLKILLAEDGKANQVLAMGLLKKWGHQVELAEDGRQALELSQNSDFDLILMDVQMPVMDGLEATRQIRLRERESGDHLRIVAMTARAMTGDRQECLAAGMDDYVAKPIRRQELMEVLARLFLSRDAPLNDASS